MRIGSVFYWDRFVQVHGQWKARWFIYLGKTSYGVSPARAHVGTTTTQLLHYAAGGYRSQHRIMRFSRGEFGFQEDCVLDVDTDVQSAYVQRLESGEDITAKGCLDNQRLERLYELISSSHGIDKITKNEIFLCFRNAGIRVKRS
jgi:hypothetical protein